jgi:FtsZ-binding cell division protein ZapB
VDAVREKSAVESKSRRLAEKVAALEAERTDLRRQLVEERREANQAIAEAQAAQAAVKLARAEGSLASQHAEEWDARFNALRGRVEKAEASTRSEVERTCAQLVDSYRELGARTADFEVPDREAGLRFLEWLQEELLVLPTIVEGFMFFASLVTCEGAFNALSREGCRHYEVFDQADESFGRETFKAEDPVVKQSAGALFDRMWGAHGREAVRERSDRAREHVMVIVLLWFVVHGCRWCLLNECACAADGVRRGCRGLRESSRCAARCCGGQTGATLGCW